MVSPPLLRHLLRVSKAHGLLHGIKAGSFDNDGLFSPVVEHVFGQRYHFKVRGRVKVFHIAKRSLSYRLYKPLTSSSLKASFDSE
jgi:hypothetical protein